MNGCGGKHRRCSACLCLRVTGKWIEQGGEDSRSIRSAYRGGNWPFMQKQEDLWAGGGKTVFDSLLVRKLSLFRLMQLQICDVCHCKPTHEGRSRVSLSHLEEVSNSQKNGRKSVFSLNWFVSLYYNKLVHN